MSEIKLVKRIKYAGDVHAAMMKLGWDAETAAAFLDSIPDADAKEVFEQRGLVQKAFEMAKADLMPVVRCKDCLYWKKAKANKKGFLICPASGMEIMATDFCSYGERRGAND